MKRSITKPYAAILCFTSCLCVVTTTHAAEPTKQDWVGYWQQGDQVMVITDPNDGAGDAINIDAYPYGVKAKADGSKTDVIEMQAYDTDLTHPFVRDSGRSGSPKIKMQLTGQTLQVARDQVSGEDTATTELLGSYQKSTLPLAMLWAEKSEWVGFHCDCDPEKIRQGMLPQLAGGYAVGKDDVENETERVVLETLSSSPETVLVLTHGNDSECSEDTFRIVTRAENGQWRGEVAAWLGLPRKPGGIKDEELWQLSKTEQQALDGLTDKKNNLSVIPRFHWDHTAKVLKVGMETCIVPPDDADAKVLKKIESLETFAANFKPKVYHLKSAAN